MISEQVGQLNNYGTLVKTAGSGTTDFELPLYNSGTVEVDSGTLDFDSSENTPIAQLTDTTLTGGTWNVTNGASLGFPTGSSITTNQGDVTLGGQGASFGAIANLASNAGSFALQSGATFTTAGPLTNSGTITLGPAAVLSVMGTYTQSASGTLGVVLGGQPASGLFGQLVSTGPAALDGTFDLSLASGFGPTTEDSYPVLTAPSVTGTFAAIQRLTSGAGQFLNVAVNANNVTVTPTTSASELAVASITVPTGSEAPGQSVSVSFLVDNLSASATNLGTWTDSVYLSLSDTFDDSAVLLGRVTHQGVVAGGTSYSETLTAPVPGLAPGAYHVYVVADSRDLLPDPNRANNLGVGSSLLTVGFPVLTLGTPVSGTIDNGQDVYYQLNLPAGSATRITASFGASDGGALYVGYQSVPTSSTFDESSASATGLAQSVLLPGTQAGTYFLLVQGGLGSAGGLPFTLSAQSLPLEVLSVDTTKGADVGTTTMTVHGSMFTAGTTLKLIPEGGGPSIAAASVMEEDSSTLFATFNLNGAATGAYNLQAVAGTQTATDAGAFTVTTGSPGQLVVQMSEPNGVRPGRTGSVTIDYSNTGGSDIPAPLFVLTTDNASLELPGQVVSSGQTIDFLGINPTGPAGVLPPGARGTIEVDFTPTSLVADTVIHFNLGEVPQDSTAINWPSQQSSLRPSNIPASAWGAVFANFESSVGSTTGQYVATLDADATYLSQLGESTADVSRLVGFEILKADAFFSAATLASVTDASYPTPGAIPLDFVRQFDQSIGGRDQSGPLGDGWTDNWQISAAADAQGDVTVTDDGATRFFTRQPDGSYMPMPDDHGTLTLVAGAYQLRETNGDLTAFNSNGSLAYEQDPNGNRVTATYNAAGELTLLTASDGSALTIAYNTQGLISQVTDPAGRASTYQYDASGQHLTTYTDKYGATHYTYLTGPTAADANALATIAYADNTHVFYTVDAQGRLTGVSRDGGAEALTYTYGPVGGYTVTDADHAATTILADDMGLIVQTTDPLGNITRNSYDADSNLTSVVAPDGTTTTYQYDSRGNITSETDPLGNVTRFTYDPTFSRLLSSQDPRGYTTSYAIDAHGNTTSVTAPDGSVEQYSYNGLGEVVQSTDARLQTTAYTYNASGQVAAVSLPDGTSDSYSYDDRGNLLAATGPGGNWSFAYDTLDLPTQVTEPNGVLTYSYNVVGQTTQIVETSGSSTFTVNYKYDALGRLEQLTDASGNNIDTYSYDPAGALISEAKGNGTSTTYQYDANGDLLKLTNLAPGGNIANSSFAYTYDALGRVISTTTGGATTNYGYDADGQLTSVSAPGESIQYAYDPSGNRTSVTDNGVVTNYSANSVNEYTAVGATTYGYDADGNMTSSTTGGATTTYAFNSLNQLTGVTSPSASTSYTYDPLGNRISSTVNGTATSNLFGQGGVLLAQLDGGGNVLAHYTYGAGLVSQVSSGGSSAYYDFNLNGSTVGVSNSVGSYVNSYSYLPFGQTTTLSAGLANPFTYVGRFGVTDTASGNFTMGYRTYDPTTGQFVSNDPLGLGGGDVNLRRYVGNDPIARIDPSGLDLIPAKVIVVMTPVEPSQPPGTITVPPSEPPGSVIVVPPGSSVPGPGGSVITCPRGGKVGYPNGKPVLTLPGSGHAIPLTGYPPNAGPDGPSGPGSQCELPPTPPKVPTIPVGGGQTPIIVSADPNDITGPAGFGAGGFITPEQTLPYTIDFENIATATAPAQTVVVTEQLNPNLDPSTFQLGAIGFGNTVINVPAGRDSYSTRIDARATLGLFVDVTTGINLSTGLVTWTFTSIDPTTLDLTSDPLAGFLPPDVTPPEGDGFVSFTIKPKANLSTGTVINASATVVFDQNAPLNTATLVNTIDAAAPTSAVQPLPANSPTSFTVRWSGTDDASGSGIADYDVFVSDNGGPFTLFQSATTQTAVTFTGVRGHTYGFYSVATDNVGHRQPTPTTAQATTTVQSLAAGGDFDGDGKTDVAVYDQTTSQFFILLSGGGAKTPQFGNPKDVNIPIAGDFDGDGKADEAIYDQTTSQFFILLSGGGALTPQFGNPKHVNIPVAGDFDGDGKTDIGIYDQTASQFFILLSGGGAETPQFGNPKDVNIPVVGDFDGDGKSDLAIYDQTTSTFEILLSGGGSIVRQFGNPSDVNIPVAGDFNGDGKTDFGIYDQTKSQFFIALSGGGAETPQFGNPADVNIPVTGDFDGDGKSDVGIYDQTKSQFFILLSSGGAETPQFGNPAHVNVPLPSIYVRGSTVRSLAQSRSGGGSSAFDLGATARALSVGSGSSLATPPVVASGLTTPTDPRQTSAAAKLHATNGARRPAQEFSIPGRWWASRVFRPDGRRWRG